MPRLTVRGKNPEDGGGWKPLPAATYNIQLDSIEETTSKAGNAQLKISGHVVDGPHDQKKVTVWYALTESALWKLQNLVEAADVDYELVDLDETDSETGKPYVAMDFDTDDLIGCIVTYDVQSYKHEGKDQNRFENERAPDGAKAKAKSRPADDDDSDDDSDDDGADEGDEEETEEEEASPPAKSKGAAPKEAAAAAGGRRTRRAR